MAKQKITVTVDAHLVGWIKQFGEESVSAAVNRALTEHVANLGRRSALGRMLEDWDQSLGPVSEAARRRADRLFAEADGLVGMDDVEPGSAA